MPGGFRLARYNPRLAFAGEGLLDTAELAQAAGLHPDLVRRLYCLGALDSAAEWRGQPLFAPSAVLRLRRMARIRQDLGLSWPSLGLVMDLLERIGDLEARLRASEVRPR